MGIQLGQRQVPERALNDVGIELTLDPGEIRTHSGTIDIQHGLSPHYFSLQIK